MGAACPIAQEVLAPPARISGAVRAMTMWALRQVVGARQATKQETHSTWAAIWAHQHDPLVHAFFCVS